MDAILAESIKAALGTYPTIRDAYYEEVFVAVFDYLDSDKGIASFKNAMKRAMVDAFGPAGDAGWEDAGAELPVDQETAEWITAMQNAEIGYIDALFETLKAMRKGEDVKKAEIAQQKAEAYSVQLDMIYNRAKIAAAGNKMLTLVGDDGVQSCADCQRMKGKRHKASWWISKNLIPGKGSDYECGGWHCQHVLVDDTGQVWTV